MRIKRLSRELSIISIMAEWHYHQWGRRNKVAGSINQLITGFWAQADSKQIPMTFVALAEGELLGFASLITHDIDAREDLSPCLANVYVTPSHRKTGIGSALVNRAVEQAGKLDVKKLYLFTPDKESLYLSLGWTTEERIILRGEEVAAMAISTNHRP
ncbi:MAG: GNAT family N-acetyltransferase [Deltaproteobacteria bacterium]|nr:GNAT family N-acetyltransferase [Deltaproteobacteria bacterium]